ncbi:hypothetical protein [Nonomuraea candida]|uniref:hypothetical protein n=1 Tax=Nonomuraea candida TaxID=359159 RepID=UPI0005BDCCA4|nr:hypothetical protein [Nonomuraea candida]
MVIRLPRRALLAAIVVDLVILMALLSGGMPPDMTGLTAAVVVAPFSLLGYLAAYRMFRAARAAGATARDALATVADALVRPPRCGP